MGRILFPHRQNSLTRASIGIFAIDFVCRGQPGVGKQGQVIGFLSCSRHSVHITGIRLSHEILRSHWVVGPAPRAFFPGFYTGFREIPLGKDAHFVLHLYATDSPGFVCHLEMSHERFEGLHVGLTRGRAERGDGACLFRHTGGSPEVRSRVGLHPKRRIGGFTVFPSTEPQQAKIEVPFVGGLQQVIHQRKVKLPLNRLQQFPTHRCKD